MSEEKKDFQLKEEELEKVSGGSGNNNSFDGLAVGDIYQSKEDPNKYAKIALFNYNNGLIAFYRGTRQDDCIMQSPPAGKNSPNVFRSEFNTDVKNTLVWTK